MRILLLAPGLLGESLALQLTAADNDLEVLLRPDQLKGHPALVIWSIEAITSFNAIRREALLLQERWTPSPLLLLLPPQVSVSRDELLTLPVAMARIAGSSIYSIPYGAYAAATVLGSIPLLLLVLICQRQIVSGLTNGAIKG